jgi:RES domain-containing protein
MFGYYPPDAENTRGARWNPAGVAAIYTSLARQGALAEAEHQISVQPIPPRTRRTIYTLELSLTSVLDLTDTELLQDLGIGPAELTADNMAACR